MSDNQDSQQEGIGIGLGYMGMSGSASGPCQKRFKLQRQLHAKLPLERYLSLQPHPIPQGLILWRMKDGK
jgi:hypothetical protein